MPVKDHSQPYPCQNSACGCKSAMQCWTSCCCNSPAQRLAWAKKHRVTPPTYAKLTPLDNPASSQKSERASDKLIVTKRAIAGRDCCRKTLTSGSRDTVSSRRKAVGADDCSVATGRTQDLPANPAANNRIDSARNGGAVLQRQLVLTVCALKCQGKSTEFTLLPWMIIAGPRTITSYELAQAPHSHSGDLSPKKVNIPPDTPPPKSWCS